jgi:hypothetical protein
MFVWHGVYRLMIEAVEEITAVCFFVTSAVIGTGNDKSFTALLKGVQ